LELRNWGGNVSKQLAQGCYPVEQWHDPESNGRTGEKKTLIRSWSARCRKQRMALIKMLPPIATDVLPSHALLAR